MVLIAVGLMLLGLALGLGITYVALVRFRLGDIDEDNKLLSQVIAEATLAVPRYEVPPTCGGLPRAQHRRERRSGLRQ